MDSPQNDETGRHTLLLRLVGPMQSWGFRSRFDHRDTALEPTRSGVIGLLCAALGWPRDADLSRFSDLQMGVRVDAPGRVMTDYQTAQDVLKASGDGVAATTQSWRAYVSARVFWWDCAAKMRNGCAFSMRTCALRFIRCFWGANRMFHRFRPLCPVAVYGSIPLCKPLCAPNPGATPNAKVACFLRAGRQSNCVCRSKRAIPRGARLPTMCP